jgi:hypothetical protein
MGVFAFYTVFHGIKSDTSEQNKSKNILYSKLGDNLNKYKERATLGKNLINQPHITTIRT